MAERTSSVNLTTPGRPASAPGGRPARALRALLARPDLSPGMLAVTLTARLASVGLLGWIGWVHWRLWQLGYRDIRIDGPFFLIDAIAAVVLAVVLLAWPRPLAGLVAAAFTASTIGALVISLWVGLFGFHESIQASFVVEALVLESIAFVTLIAWTVIALTRSRTTATT